MHIYPIILSGGAGTRLWPLSRALYPKQFIRFIDGLDGSLLQETARRRCKPSLNSSTLMTQRTRFYT
jgi:mannose-1-phosphate guanylyltransferase